MGFSWKKAVGDFGTGVAAFVPGRYGAGARAKVRETYSQSSGFGRTALGIVGPPQSNAEAVLSLGLSAIPFGKVGGTAAKITVGSGKMGFGGIIGRAALGVGKFMKVPFIKKVAVVGGVSGALVAFGPKVGKATGQSIGAVTGSALSGASRGLFGVPFWVVALGAVAVAVLVYSIWKKG